MHTPLDFEKPIAALEAKIEELRHLTGDDKIDIAGEIAELQAKAEKLLRSTYAGLGAWQKVQVARHPGRPHTSDYIAGLIEDFVPLAGDRLYREDRAIIGGVGRFRGRSVVVLGQEKGADTETRVRHNFGMAHPEGYRKAQRLMQLAQRFKLPLIAFVDTAGAYPGIEAEERGQAEAIARCLAVALDLDIPTLAVVIGEGGSGGAVALAASNRILMLEHSVYSVISPEGCASILWRSSENARDAAEALRLTAGDLRQLGVIDILVEEPVGGAHRAPAATIARVGEQLASELEALSRLEPAALRSERREKFIEMGRRGLA